MEKETKEFFKAFTIVFLSIVIAIYFIFQLNKIAQDEKQLRENNTVKIETNQK